MVFPEPVISIAIEPKTKADLDKLGGSLQKLAYEDPSFRTFTTEIYAQYRTGLDGPETALLALILVLLCHPNTPWDAVPGTWDALIGLSTVTWLALAPSRTFGPSARAMAAGNCPDPPRRFNAVWSFLPLHTAPPSP